MFTLASMVTLLLRTFMSIVGEAAFFVLRWGEGFFGGDSLFTLLALKNARNDAVRTRHLKRTPVSTAALAGISSAEWIDHTAPHADVASGRRLRLPRCVRAGGRERHPRSAGAARHARTQNAGAPV